MDTRFQLMNKDRLVADLHVNNSCAYIKAIYGPLPPVMRDIQVWIDDRTSPFGRANINMLLKLAHIDNKIEYLSITKALSLNDTLWINDMERPTTWAKVSPYRNKLSRIMSEAALNNYYNGGNLRSPSPDYKLDGAMDKCWKRADGKLQLVKCGGEKYSGITGNGPYMEYYVSQVAEQLGIKDFVR